MSIRLHNKIPQVQAHFKAQILAHLDQTTANINDTIKNSMRAKKSGRMYRRHQKSLNLVPTMGSTKTTAYLHQASAPGQSPAIDKGDLYRSLRTMRMGDYVRYVIAGSEELGVYPFVLEFGGARMAAHPYMGPAFEQEKRRFKQGLRDIYSGTASFTSQPYGFNN